MKINLISFYSGWNEYPTKYSLGTLRIASYLGDNDEIEVKIFPIDTESNEVQEKISKITEGNPDIIGIPCYMWTEKLAQKISRDITKINPEILKVVGGPSTGNINFEKWQNDEIFVLGEGEEALREICEAKIDNPSFNSNQIDKLNLNNVFSKTIQQKQIGEAKLNKQIPIRVPLFSKKMMEMQTEPDGKPIESEKNEKFTGYETTRGCAYRCGYCGHKTRDNIGIVDTEIVRQELKNMKREGINRIFVVDPIIGGTKQNGKEVLKMFQEIIPEAKLIIYLRPEYLDDEYVEILSKTNLEEVRFGIQTLNENVPAWVRSNSVGKIKQELSKLKDKDINWRAELIAGLPGDDLKGIQDSLKFVIENFQPTVVAEYHLTAIPGTKLYELLDEGQEQWLKVDENSQAKESYSYTNQEFKEMSQFAVAITSLYNLLKEKEPKKEICYDKLCYYIRKNITSEALKKFEEFDTEYAKNYWEDILYKEMKITREKANDCKTWAVNGKQGKGDSRG